MIALLTYAGLRNTRKQEGYFGREAVMTIREIVASALERGVLTSDHELDISRGLFEESVTVEDLTALDRLLQAIERHEVQMVA